MKLCRSVAIGLAAWGLVLGAGAQAQVQQIDPNTAIDADLKAAPSAPATTPPPPAQLPPVTPDEPAATATTGDPSFSSPAAGSEPPAPAVAPVPPAGAAKGTGADSATYHEDDLIGAAEGVFGRGAKGLALMIQDILKKQGQPNAYITGREAGGAVVVGLRYGSGTLHHKIEGERPVYWTGPSVGFDLGANAANTFVLVYNLNDSEDLYKRFGAGEGQAYFVGGFNVSYLRRGDVVVIPVRFGAGMRLGVNAGYMKFSRTQKWMPF